MLKAGLGEPDVAAAPHPERPDRLRDRSFDPGSLLVRLLEFFTPLAPPCPLHAFVQCSGFYMNHPSLNFRCRAFRQTRAYAALGFQERRLQDLIAARVAGWLPLRTLFSLGARDDLPLPIDHEMREIKSRALLSLP